jgi:hypothetical protein
MTTPMTYQECKDRYTALDQRYECVIVFALPVQRASPEENRAWRDRMITENYFGSDEPLDLEPAYVFYGLESETLDAMTAAFSSSKRTAIPLDEDIGVDVEDIDWNTAMADGEGFLALRSLSNEPASWMDIMPAIPTDDHVPTLDDGRVNLDSNLGFIHALKWWYATVCEEGELIEIPIVWHRWAKNHTTNSDRVALATKCHEVMTWITSNDTTNSTDQEELHENT